MDTSKDSMRRKKKRCSDWSKLCPDVLGKIMETLSPLDSNRAKIVCLDWYSVWKTCVNRPPCPLRIIHQGGLFDPEEDKTYTRKQNRSNMAISGWFDPKEDEKNQSSDYCRYSDSRNSSCTANPFARKKRNSSDYYQYSDSRKSSCMASYGSWLLMAGSCYEIFLFNLLTRKRINLPSMKPAIRDGDVRLERRGWKSSAVLWINEVTGDYFVACIFRQRYLLSISKGDDSWSNLTLKDNASGFYDVAYRNSILYVLTIDNHIKIFDFSREFPRKGNPYRNHPFCFDEKPSESVWTRKIAIEESGEVLVILSLKEEMEYEEKLLFYVFKMNLESFKWERVESIGDDKMLIFGHGVPVKAPVKDYLGDGSKSGSILFVADDVWPDHQDHDHRSSDCGVFDIATGIIEWPKRSCFYINETQWFVPGVAYN